MDYSSLEEEVSKGLSSRELAKHFSLSQSTITYWLKKHDLRTLPKSKPMSDGTIVECGCGRCYSWHKNSGHSKTRCNSCLANAQRTQKKKRAILYKGGSCQHCGYNKCLRALVFHHRDPSEKNFGIGSWRTSSWKRIKAELDKCDLLCANCHAEVHAEDTTLS